MKHRNPMHDNWETPKKLYNQLDNEFHFDFDPCPLNYTIDTLSLSHGNKVTSSIHLTAENSKRPLLRKPMRKQKIISFVLCSYLFQLLQRYSMRSYSLMQRYDFCGADLNLQGLIRKVSKYQTRQVSMTA